MIIFGALITATSVLLFFLTGMLMEYKGRKMDLGELFMLWASVILFSIGISLLLTSFKEIGYKEGQIDCLNGVIKYEEVTRESTTWEPIKEDNQ